MINYPAAATASGNDIGYIEDTRTLQADKDMLQRIRDYLNPFKKSVKGVETPWRTSLSGEMEASMAGQYTVISALELYKQWKVDKGYQKRDLIVLKKNITRQIQRMQHLLIFSLTIKIKSSI